MEKFVLVGEYTSNEQKYQVRDSTMEIHVPLLDSNRNLRFGIENIIHKLRMSNIFPSENGIDFLCFAVIVFLADTQISRSLHSQDSWTREIKLILPVYNLEKWTRNSEAFTRMLNFLTGDRWIIQFTQRDTALLTPRDNQHEEKTFDSVTLYSGGMDSLISVINSLEQKKRIALVSHASDPLTKNAQKKLLAHFNSIFPDNKLSYFDLWTAFDAELIPDGGKETTTRSRSFLFISFGICVLSGIAGTTVLDVPENALIALNVPLDNLRVGSHSTRTTHPFYLELWNRILSDMNINASVYNPFWNKTKGEMANECLNKALLHDVIADSMSCSSPYKIRFKKNAPQHCGYCVPCIIRRAALAKAFGIENDPTTYYLSDVSKIQHATKTEVSVQLRSFEYIINRIKTTPAMAKVFIYKSGPLMKNEKYINDLASVYERGLFEVDDFIQQALLKK